MISDVCTRQQYLGFFRHSLSACTVIEFAQLRILQIQLSWMKAVQHGTLIETFLMQLFVWDFREEKQTNKLECE